MDRASVEEQVQRMEDYLDLKVALRDWHGVADAAMDIRELEAQLRVLDALEKDRGW